MPEVKIIPDIAECCFTYVAIDYYGNRGGAYVGTECLTHKCIVREPTIPLGRCPIGRLDALEAAVISLASQRPDLLDALRGNTCPKSD
jgi:hypothetical protein